MRAKTLPLATAIEILLNLQPLIQELAKLKYTLKQHGIKMEVTLNLTHGTLTVRFKEDNKPNANMS